MGNIVEFVYKLQDQMSGTLNRVAKTATTVARNMNNVKSANNNASASNRKLAASTNVANQGFSKLAKIAGGYIGIMQAFRLTGWFTGLGMDMEQTRAKFEVLLGSMDKGNKMIADLNKFANATPFQNADLIKNSETMLAFGINAKKILPTLKSIGDISMGNKEKLSGLTLAYSQVASTGRLMGQDLNQMINQGFNPLLVISQKTGRSMADLREDMSKGKISFEMVEEAFKSATAKGGQFYGMMEKMSKTGTGLMSTFLGALKDKLTQYAERLTPFIGKIMSWGIVLVKHFDQIAKTIWRALLPIRALITGLITLFKHKFIAVMISVIALLVKLPAIIALVVKAFTLLKTAVVTNPFLAVLGVLSMVVGAFVMMHKKTKEAADDIYDLNKAAGSYASDERARLEMIFDKLKRTNPKSEERNKLAKQLNEMYPDTLKNIDLEKAGLNELETAYNSIIAVIERKAMARAIEDRLTELYKKKNDDKLEASRLHDKMYGSYYTYSSDASGTKHYEYSKKDKERYDYLKSQSKNVDKRIKEMLSLVPKTSIGGQGGGSFDGGTGGLGGSKSISDLTGGGSKATNVNITLRNLIENNTIRSETAEGGIDNLTDKLIESLLRVVNSANRIAVQ